LSGFVDNVKIVYVKCDLETLKRRDTKGLYYRALLPDKDPNKVYNFTGVSDPYEEPHHSDLILETNREAQSFSIAKLENFILRSIL
jgi:adenylylsulfate kinase